MPIGRVWYVHLLQVNSFRLSLGLLGRRQPDGISHEIYLGMPAKDPGGREQEENIRIAAQGPLGKALQPLLCSVISCGQPWVSVNTVQEPGVGQQETTSGPAALPRYRFNIHTNSWGATDIIAVFQRGKLSLQPQLTGATWRKVSHTPRRARTHGSERWKQISLPDQAGSRARVEPLCSRIPARLGERQ